MYTSQEAESRVLGELDEGNMRFYRHTYGCRYFVIGTRAARTIASLRALFSVAGGWIIRFQ